MAGRGRGALLRRALRKPGPPEDEKLAPVQMLNQMLKNLNLHAETSDIDNIYKVANDYCSSKAALEDTVKLIYNKCVRDWEFASVGAKICEKLCNIEADSTKFRTCLLTHIQNDFKKKEHLRNNDKQRYLGCLTLICQLYGLLRTGEGEPLQPLLGPTTQSILELIGPDAKDEEVDAGAQQILSVGRVIELQSKSNMEKIMCEVRKRIVSGRTPQKERCLFLEVLETYATGWDSLPEEAANFYCDTMADIEAQRF